MFTVLSLSVLQLKVKMKPRPWSKHWERPIFNIQGIRFDLALTPVQMEGAQKLAQPWRQFDMLKEYDTSEMEKNIYQEVQEQLNKWAREILDWRPQTNYFSETTTIQSYSLVLEDPCPAQLCVCSGGGAYQLHDLSQRINHLVEMSFGFFLLDRLCFLSLLCEKMWSEEPASIRAAFRYAGQGFWDHFVRTSAETDPHLNALRSYNRCLLVSVTLVCICTVYKKLLIKVEYYPDLFRVSFYFGGP